MQMRKPQVGTIQIRKLSASRIEWKYIYQLTKAIENENIRNYVENQIEWYVVKASRYRFYDYALKVLTVLMPTVVIILQQYLNTNDPLVQMAVLGGATVTSASSIFIKFHDKRVLYRKAAEQLKEETMLYITSTGKYRTEERDEQFVIEFGRIVETANEEWGRIEKEKREQEKREKNRLERLEYLKEQKKNSLESLGEPKKNSPESQEEPKKNSAESLKEQKNSSENQEEQKENSSESLKEQKNSSESQEEQKNSAESLKEQKNSSESQEEQKNSPESQEEQKENSPESLEEQEENSPENL